MRNRYEWRKILTLAVLCPALALSSAACAQSGNQNGNQTAQDADSQASDSQISDPQNSNSDSSSEKAQETAFTPAADTPCTRPGQKNETVYVKADAAGTPTKKTVEVVLKEIAGTDPIEDRSGLREIRNTEGDEEFFETEGGRYLWQNKGNEIHYKGLSDAPLPVNVRITYFLDGQQVTAGEIAGKSGDVKIRFDYENSTQVPFMALSAVVLPSDIFEDVRVEGGRVMDMGEQKAVIGYAFPGLTDSLKLRDYEPTEEIELPEYVEIEAKAENFELDFTATVVSTGLFEDLEDKDLEDLEKLPEDMKDLTDASSEIRDAARELADGGAELGGYLGQYFDGLSQLSEGTGSLDQGLAALSQNITKISEGSKSLQEGLAQIDRSLAGIDLSQLSGDKDNEKAAEAAGAALAALGQSRTALAGKLAAVQTDLETVRSFSEEVNTYMEQVRALQKAVEEMPAPDLAAADLENGWTDRLNKEASSQAGEKAEAAAEKAASEAVDAAASGAAKATADDARKAVRETVEDSDFLDDLGLTDEQKARAREMISDEIAEAIVENTGDETEITVNVEDIEISLDAEFGEIRDGIQKEAEGCRNTLKVASDKITEPTVPDPEALSPEKTEEIAKIIGNMEQSLAVIGAYAEGMASARSSLTELSAALTQLKSGISQLSGGSAQLTEGLGLFEKALASASEGSSQLASAMSTVSSAGGELSGAFGILADGLEQFADGIAEFDEEGIRSLAELAGPEYNNVIRGIRAARDAEQSYTNYSGILDGQKGSVRFIIETEEIAAE